MMAMIGKRGTDYAWWQIILIIISMMLILWMILFSMGLKDKILQLFKYMFGFLP